MSTPPTSGHGPSSESTERTQSSALESAKDAGRELGAKAKATAESAGRQAMDAAEARADSAKRAVADEVSSFGNSLRKASHDMREGSPQEQAFGYMADALADISDTVRGKNLSEIMGELSRFGRRNPAAFLGGAALLGFAGMRLARASARDRYPYPGETDQPAPATPVSATPSSAGGYAPASTGPGQGVAAHQSAAVPPQPAAAGSAASNPSTPSGGMKNE